MNSVLRLMNFSFSNTLTQSWHILGDGTVNGSYRERWRKSWGEGQSRQNAAVWSRECTMPAGLNFLRSFVDQDHFPSSYRTLSGSQAGQEIFVVAKQSPTICPYQNGPLQWFFQLFSPFHVCCRLGRATKNTAEYKYEKVIRREEWLFSKHGKWRAKLTLKCHILTRSSLSVINLVTQETKLFLTKNNFTTTRTTDKICITSHQDLSGWDNR